MKAELKKEKNRNLLMESAYKLFTEEGFHKTTIASIAKNAGLGKGTFYLYFKDKEDIRDSLIIFKSSKLLHDAIENSDLSESDMTFYDRIFWVNSCSAYPCRRKMWRISMCIVTAICSKVSLSTYRISRIRMYLSSVSWCISPMILCLKSISCSSISAT